MVGRLVSTTLPVIDTYFFPLEAPAHDAMFGFRFTLARVFPPEGYGTVTYDTVPRREGVVIARFR